MVKKEVSIKKPNVKPSETKTFSEGLKYPFNKFKRLFNFYWALIPILGWFAVAGYVIKIRKNMMANDFFETPDFGSFVENMKVGFFYFFYILVFGLLILLFTRIPVVGWIFSLYFALVMPIMRLDYTKNLKFSEGWDFVNATKLVFSNFGDYIVAWLKYIGVILLYLVGSILIITLIVTIPAMIFFDYYFITDFYNKYGKK